MKHCDEILRLVAKTKQVVDSFLGSSQMFNQKSNIFEHLALKIVFVYVFLFKFNPTDGSVLVGIAVFNLPWTFSYCSFPEKNFPQN